jgi:hypothetical protein
MVQTEELASYVRRRFPFSFCPVCVAARLQTDEKSIREKSQVLVLLRGFRVSQRICSGCGRTDDVLEWGPNRG